MFDLHRLTIGELHRLTRWLVKSPFNQHVSPQKKHTNISVTRIIAPLPPGGAWRQAFAWAALSGQSLGYLGFWLTQRWRFHPMDPWWIYQRDMAQDSRSINGHLRRTCTFWVSDSARPLQKRKFRTKWNGNIRNQWLIGKSLPEAHQQMSKCWLRTRVKWHERIHAQLNEWTNEPLTHVS